MTITDSQYAALARTYLFATAGSFLPGLVHNMNNFIQVLDMQLELISRKSQSGLGSSGAGAGNSMERLTKSVSGLSEQMKSADERMFYCGEDQTQLNLGTYLEWIEGFWTNNLFFKHHIDLQIDVQTDIPNLEVPPMYLTLCLEEPLKNAVEALHDDQPEISLTILLETLAKGDGVVFRLSAPTRIPKDIDPWQAGATSKAYHLGYGLNLVSHFADKLGWTISFDQLEDGTVFSLTVPSVRTVVP